MPTTYQLGKTPLQNLPFRLIPHPTPSRESIANAAETLAQSSEMPFFLSTLPDGQVLGAVSSAEGERLQQLADMLGEQEREIAGTTVARFAERIEVVRGSVVDHDSFQLVMPLPRQPHFANSLPAPVQTWAASNEMLSFRFPERRVAHCSTIVWGRYPRGETFMLDTLLAMTTTIKPSGAMSIENFSAYVDDLAEQLGVAVYWIFQGQKVARYER